MWYIILPILFFILYLLYQDYQKLNNIRLHTIRSYGEYHQDLMRWVLLWEERLQEEAYLRSPCTQGVRKDVLILKTALLHQHQSRQYHQKESLILEQCDLISKYTSNLEKSIILWLSYQVKTNYPCPFNRSWREIVQEEVEQRKNRRQQAEHTSRCFNISFNRSLFFYIYYYVLKWDFVAQPQSLRR